ncbi:2-methylisocitrate lyase [Thalassocella blandensis]|nr:2-methylisocitrate lyase [Thalassocella blandensis]
MQSSPGQLFREALKQHNPLQIVGTINAYTAMMASQIGHKALYISGGACANMSYGLPDLGITMLNDVLEDARRITAAVETPLMVDIDTGWGGAFNIARTVKEMIRANVAAVHIEDQVAQKRCGHRPNKAIVSQSEMVDRIKAAVDARTDDNFFIMARTDAYAVEGLEAAAERCAAFVEAGADGIFAEAMEDLQQYAKIKNALKVSSGQDVPVLANMTEFGKSPIFTKDALQSVGVDMILYPLTAVRAMNKAAELVYQELLSKGDQSGVIDSMQTRKELYAYLNYNDYEDKLDALFAEQQEKE